MTYPFNSNSNRCFNSLFILLFYIFVSFSSYGQQKPTVYVLATGGTIAGTGESAVSSAYKAGGIRVEDLLMAVPILSEAAHIKSEQIADIGSQDMTQAIWINLAQRINQLAQDPEISGFVITHGTDTQEETAYFLNLTAKTDKPIVLVGAMRPATALSADGPRNLFQAVACAASPQAKGRGVMLVMDDQILGADDLQKTHTLKVGSFENPNFGPLGFMYNKKPYFTRQSLKKHTLASEFDISGMTTLPKVSIVMGHVDADAEMVNFAIEKGAKGIVYAGVGNGNLSTLTMQALANAVKEKQIAVLRSSRSPFGPTTQWDEVDDARLGFATSWFLNPQKARVLLMLALTKTNDIHEIQRLFTEY